MADGSIGKGARDARRRVALKWLCEVHGSIEPTDDGYICEVADRHGEGKNAVEAIEACRSGMEGPAPCAPSPPTKLRRAPPPARQVRSPRPATPEEVPRRVPTSPFVPRDYQVGAVEAIVDELRRSCRATLVAPCGIGKTAVAARVFGEMSTDDGVTLVFVPRISLVHQTLEAWRWSSSVTFASFSVCSEEGSTDAEQLAEFLRGEGRRVVVCTYHSVNVVMTAQEEADIVFDLVVLDEAHHTVGYEDKHFQRALYDSCIDARARLFMTATPRLFEGDGASMDEESIYGPVAWSMSLRDAIERRLVADYRVLLMAVEVGSVRDAIRANERCSDAVDVRARLLAQNVAILKAIRRHRLDHVAVFHNTIGAAARFADPDHPDGLSHAHAVASRVVPDLAELPSVSACVHSGIPAGQRSATMKEFELAGSGVISNVRCLAEGVDVPELDSAVFCGNRYSWVDVVQIVGRTLRLPAGRPDKIATILVPVLLDDGEPVDLNPVVSILSTLKDEDAQVAEMLCETWAHTSDYTKAGGSVVQVEVVSDDVSAEDVARCVALAAVSFRDRRWYNAYDHLLDYTEKTGGAYLPHDDVHEGFPLGKWCAAQRSAYRRSLLSQRRVEMLESLPGWPWDVSDMRWHRGYERLCAFVSEHGTTKMPRDAPLHGWCTSQRQYFRSGHMRADHVEKLEQLPDWEWRVGEPETVWMEAYEILADFAEKHGHTRLPPDHLGPANLGMSIYSWVCCQQYRCSARRCAAAHRKLLNKLPGWKEGVADRHKRRREEWTKLNRLKRSPTYLLRRRNTRDERWWTAFEMLKDFCGREGHAVVPTSYVVPENLRSIGVDLRVWLEQTQMKYVDGNLDPQRREQLAQLAGWPERICIYRQRRERPRSRPSTRAARETSRFA